MITKQSKLLFLFFSRDNPLWGKLLGGSPTQADIASDKVTGITQSTLSNWRKGGEVDRRTMSKVFDKLQSYVEAMEDSEKKPSLLKQVQRFADAYTSPSASVYDVATDILGMSIEQCQTIIDEVIFDKFTIFPALCYGSTQEAGEPFARFGGNYHMWVQRGVGDNHIWLKCPLRARYILKLKNSAVIRCKLNAPILIPDRQAMSHWEYDGFLRTRHDKVFWKFEKREKLGSDFFDFVTNQGQAYGSDDQERLTLFGSYLSTGQDTARSIVSGNVILRRLSMSDIEAELARSGAIKLCKSARDDAQKVRVWMSNTACVLEPGHVEYPEIETAWNELRHQEGTQTDTGENSSKKPSRRGHATKVA